MDEDIAKDKALLFLLLCKRCRECVNLINLCPQLFASVFPSLAKISETCSVTFVTSAMKKTDVERSELVNVPCGHKRL